ncbi:MAG TPA: hypothetical protein VGD89_14090 [Flavipsychrobacter sp.]
MVACAPPTGETTTETTAQTAAPAKHDVVQVVFIADRSKSFITKYAYPDPSLFKPLVEKISQTSTLDFRYGIIKDYSDVTFDRYYKPFVPVAEQDNTNPWMEQEKAAPAAKATDWNEFVLSVTAKLTAPASNESDVASAIGHAVTILQEHSGKQRIHKVLILCTDGLDSHRQLPTVPADIEVLAIGILPDNQIEQVLHTSNVKRFESLHATLDFLTSQTF